MNTPDLTQMLATVSSNLPQIMALITAVIYIIGMYIIVVSVAAMRKAPLLRSAGQGEPDMWTCIKHMFVGAALLYLPTTINVATQTLFSSYATGEPYAYPTDASATNYLVAFHSALLLVQLIGVIAIAKGVHELGYGQGGNSQEKGHTGQFAKGIAHIVGGVLCCNLPLTIRVIFATLGITGVFN